MHILPLNPRWFISPSPPPTLDWAMPSEAAQGLPKCDIEAYVQGFEVIQTPDSSIEAQADEKGSSSSSCRGPTSILDRISIHSKCLSEPAKAVARSLIQKVYNDREKVLDEKIRARKDFFSSSKIGPPTEEALLLSLRGVQRFLRESSEFSILAILKSLGQQLTMISPQSSTFDDFEGVRDWSDYSRLFFPSITDSDKTVQEIQSYARELADRCLSQVCKAVPLFSREAITAICQEIGIQVLEQSASRME